jgi:hypothetical protein
VAGGCLEQLSASADDYDMLVANGPDVYWTHDGLILGVPIAGGATVTLAQSIDFDTGIAVDATNVYWGSINERVIAKMNRQSGVVTTLVSNASPAGAAGITAIAVSGPSVYWLDARAGVMTVPIEGGEPSTFVPDMTGIFLIADAANIYWSTDNADGPSPDVLMQAPVGGGQPITLASALTCPCEIAVDDCNVYWTESGDGSNGTVSKTPRGGGAISQLASSLVRPSGIAVDRTGVYWTAFTEASPNGGSALTKLPFSGGAAEVLSSVEGGDSVDGLSSEGQSIYWPDNRGLMKLTR